MSGHKSSYLQFDTIYVLKRRRAGARKAKSKKVSGTLLLTIDNFPSRGTDVH
jgi:hypothetical protein